LSARLLENIIILTGKGRNGKDTLITNLLYNTLGSDYYITGNKSLLTKNEVGGISQECANLNNKRAVVYNEPNKNEPLKVSNLKTLRGCPKLTARGLYSKKTEVNNVSTQIILANGLPPLDNPDPAIACSLVIVPFRALFYTRDDMKNCPENTPYLYDVDAYYKSKEFIDEYKLVFMNILLKYYKQFKADGYIIKNIPETMRSLAKEYMADSDDFANWFYSIYEKTNEQKDMLNLREVYNIYKRSDLYENLSKRDKRKNNFNKLVKDINENPNLRMFYKETYDAQRHYKKYLSNHKLRLPENDED
jgi:phage/plasmid-associated DNA primase